MGFENVSSKFIIFYLLLICSVLIVRDFLVVTASEFETKLCTDDLENKFLRKDGKCRYGGLLPVKGSCTAYIICFGGDLMKPLKQAECSKSDGMAFDVEYLRCRPVRELKTCPQRECYPEESKINDGESSLTEDITLNGVYYEDEVVTTFMPFLDTIIRSTTVVNITSKSNSTNSSHSFSSSASSSVFPKSRVFQSKKHCNLSFAFHTITVVFFANLAVN